MAVRTSVLVAVCACLVAAVVGDEVHDLEEEIKKLNKEESLIIIENELLKREYANLTSEYAKYIEDLYRRRGVLQEGNTLLLNKLSDKRVETFGLQIKKHILEEDLINLEEDKKKLDLVIRIVTRELIGYREGREMGDGELCQYYKHHNITKVLSNKLMVGEILLSDSKKSNDTELIIILKGKVKQAQEAVWDAQDETKLLEEKIEDLKAYYERESKEVTEQISRIASNEKELEKAVMDFDIELQELKKETQELEDQKEERTKIVNDDWDEIRKLHKEYETYTEDISCYAWLRDWAFQHIPPL